MKNNFIGILITILGVAVALCAWLYPFRPVAQSPFDKTNNSSAPLPIDSSGAQTQQPIHERSKLDAEIMTTHEVSAVIDDPDGYTNVRSGPGLNFEIITRVVNDEIFFVINQRGIWWQIRTRDGKYGYMHRSRIRMK